MKLPKILIFTVTYAGKDYCLKEFLANVSNINYPDVRHIFIDNSPNLNYVHKLRRLGLTAYHTERGNNSREAIARSQNFARRIMLRDGYDYMFSLESDIMCPPTIIQDLLKRGRDVISGLYQIGDKDLRVPCITLAKWNADLGAFGTRLLQPEEFKDYYCQGEKRVQSAGMGCCLIHKRILEHTAFTYDTRLKGHSDIYFFNSMFKKKIPVYVDTDIRCDHKNSKWCDVRDR